MARPLSDFATTRPRLALRTVLGLSLFIGLFAALPTLIPGFLSLPALRVDTNPENMLPAEEPVRVFHDRMKDTFELSDLLVIGVVNEQHPQGVWNAKSLAGVFELTEYVKTLHGQAIGETDPLAGVLEIDIISPSTVDQLEPAGPGTLRFDWLMAKPPATDQEALDIRRRAARLPFLQGTLLSEDGKALALYVPLSSKGLSHRIYRLIEQRIEELDSEDQFLVTGLPVAEDTFGFEMFVQMAISAPVAMLLIFILIWLFFRHLILCSIPLLVALCAVICTMGLLVLSGQTLHIMSSMIPIFIMPIAVLDAIHILSELFDRVGGRSIEDRTRLVSGVMSELSSPMLFTSLTSAAGFASLALTPIPPVRVFGVFVAIGVMLAWAFTMILVPAIFMLLPAEKTTGFGARRTEGGMVGKALGFISNLADRRVLVLSTALAAMAVAAWGISRIEVNDNPIRWFRSSHPIRQADKILNEHFGGTYMAYLALTSNVSEDQPAREEPLSRTVEPKDEPNPADASNLPDLPLGLESAPGDRNPETEIGTGSQPPDLPLGLEPTAGDHAPESEAKIVPTEATAINDREALFKQPEILRYIEKLQQHMAAGQAVGKSTSLADLVKTVHRELKGGSEEELRVPDSSAAVAQCLVQYESGHRPHDLWHFVTPDFQNANLWFQLRSGDNQDMGRVAERLTQFLEENPPPAGLEARWYGLTYINLIWQEKMVLGMLEAFAGSFAVVFLMMSLLFRSVRWGFLSMLPMTLTIGLIYGLIGVIGKDYDMPVAVLSALALGLAIDFAIHFLVRSRHLQHRLGSWPAAKKAVFDEPARAILRNVLVVALGFAPLLAAPLVPYNAVGVLMALILVISGLATLTVLPAMLHTFGRFFFKQDAE